MEYRDGILDFAIVTLCKISFFTYIAIAVVKMFLITTNIQINGFDNLFSVMLHIYPVFLIFWIAFAFMRGD